MKPWSGEYPEFKGNYFLKVLHHLFTHCLSSIVNVIFYSYNCELMTCLKITDALGNIYSVSYG